MGNGLGMGVGLALGFLVVHFGLPSYLDGAGAGGGVDGGGEARGVLGVPEGAFEANERVSEVERSLKENAAAWRAKNEAPPEALSRMARLKQAADGGDNDAAVEYAKALVAEQDKYGVSTEYLFQAIRDGHAGAMRTYASWYEEKGPSDYYTAVALCWYWLAEAHGWVDVDGVISTLSESASEKVLDRARSMMSAHADQFGLLTKDEMKKPSP